VDMPLPPASLGEASGGGSKDVSSSPPSMAATAARGAQRERWTTP
jgi:hypothetical protein